MSDEDLEPSEVCWMCGNEIQTAVDRCFAFSDAEGEGGLVCWDCALLRGGIYDSDYEMWTRPPDLTRPRPRAV